MARAAHEALVQAGTIPEGACADPEDLAVLADTVLAETGNLDALIVAIGPTRLRTATPNEGYLIAAALLREGCIRWLLTLNYDLAIIHALSEVSAGDAVSVITGPNDLASMGLTNVVFLHGHAMAEGVNWVLTTEQLRTWRAQWRTAVTANAAASAAVVLVGLGDVVANLLESVRQTQQSIPAAQIFQVGLSPYATAAYSQELGIPMDAYVQAGWCQFMRDLGAFVAGQQAAAVEAAEQAIATQNGTQPLDSAAIRARLVGLGVFALGRIRAKWMLTDGKYEPASSNSARQTAEVVQLLALLEQASNVTAYPNESGSVEVLRDGRTVAFLFPVAAQGTWTWNAVEAKVRTERTAPSYAQIFAAAIVTGCERATSTAPADVVSGVEGDYQGFGRPSTQMFTAAEIRANPQVVTVAFS